MCAPSASPLKVQKPAPRAPRVVQAARERTADAIAHGSARRGEHATVLCAGHGPNLLIPAQVLRLGQFARLAGAHGAYVMRIVDGAQLILGERLGRPQPDRI